MTCKTYLRMLLAAALTAAALAAPAHADAAYSITQDIAESYTKDAADTRYGDRWGVTADGAYCRPQGFSTSRLTIPGRYHRWVCTWVGSDFEEADVFGSFIIAGNTGAGSYSYRQIRGGLRWA